jgi:NAD dependent epimerase/dehydratase family enzyme
LEDENLAGAYNAVSPVNLTNKTLMKQLAKKLRKPFFFPAIPELMLKLVLGEMSVIITRGNRISAKKIQDAGYIFQHPDFKTFLESKDFK